MSDQLRSGEEKEAVGKDTTKSFMLIASWVLMFLSFLIAAAIAWDCHSRTINQTRANPPTNLMQLASGRSCWRI